MVYVPRQGSRLSRQDAQILGEHLERIAQSGPLEPEDVVGAARDKASPLHRYFEWDDKVAGEAYRRDQARYYLRNIEVIRAPDSAPIRAFHVISVQRDETTESGYLGIERIVQERSLLDQVIADERRRLMGCRARLLQYESLIPEALGALTLAIDALVV